MAAFLQKNRPVLFQYKKNREIPYTTACRNNHCTVFYKLRRDSAKDSHGRTCIVMFSALNPLGDIKLIWVQPCVNVSVSYVSTCLHNNISIHYNLDLDDKGESG